MSGADVSCDRCARLRTEETLLKNGGEQQCAACAAGELRRRMRTQELSIAFCQDFYDTLFPGGRPMEQHITEAKGTMTAAQVRRKLAQHPGEEACD